MDWMYLVYFFLGLLIFFGSGGMGKGKWNEEYTSLKQTKTLQGISALGIAFHHMAQKTCAPWHSPMVIVHGLDVFLPVGYMLVGVFLFCSGLGLYKSFKTKPGYLEKGFFRRRILPLIIAFWLSEILYTVVRLLMGEKMNALTVLWYLSGLHMANTNAWYLIVIPFFYLAFQAAFRLCRREGTAIFWLFVFTLGYTVLGACIDHQGDWWMRGEWWYNSILLFPLGVLFGRYEKPVTRFFRKGYWFWLIFFLAGFFLLFWQSEWLIDHRWGYYGEGTALKIPHRLMSAGIQWTVALFFVGFFFLLMMKVRFGNKVLSWLGAVTLDFYLIHGLFVELFGYSFLDVAKSLVYIRNVPLYIAAVLAGSVAGTLLFRRLRLWITSRLIKGSDRPAAARVTEGQNEPAAEQAARAQNRAAEKQKEREKARIRLQWIRRLILLVLFLGVCGIMLFGFQKNKVRTVGGLIIEPPEGYETRFSDGRYAVWEYTGKDRKPGNIVLDEEIRGDYAQNFADADAVLRECDWMTDAELYVNPHGVRMARGFARNGDYPERRYYVENGKAVFLLSMIEDSRYYSPEDCEQAMLQTADRIRKK